MAKKEEVKVNTKVEVCDKIIETVNYLVIPVAGVAAIWGADISVYVAAGAAMINAILEFAKLFLNK